MKLSPIGIFALLSMAEADHVQRRGGARLDKLGLFEAAPLPHRRQVANVSSGAGMVAPVTTPAPLVTTQLVTVNQSVVMTTTKSLWSNTTVTLTLPCSSCPGGVTTVTSCPTQTPTWTPTPTSTPNPTTPPALIVSPTTVWASGTVTMTVPCPACTQVSPQPTSPVVYISSNYTWTQSAPGTASTKTHWRSKSKPAASWTWVTTTIPCSTTATPMPSSSSSAVWVSGGTVTTTIPCSTTMPMPWVSVSRAPPAVVVTPIPSSSTVVTTRVPVGVPVSPPAPVMSTMTVAPPAVVVPTSQAAASQTPQSQPQQSSMVPQPQPPSMVPQPPQQSSVIPQLPKSSTTPQPPKSTMTPRPQPQPQPSTPATTPTTTSTPGPAKTGAAASFGVSAMSGLLFGLSGSVFALL